MKYNSFWKSVMILPLYFARKSSAQRANIRATTIEKRRLYSPLPNVTTGCFSWKIFTLMFHKKTIFLLWNNFCENLPNEPTGFYIRQQRVIWLKLFFSFAGKNYLSLDWHPRAKELFYNEKAAEEVCQDESFLQKNSTPANKQQSVSLNECLELYTTTEKLKEDNAW